MSILHVTHHLSHGACHTRIHTIALFDVLPSYCCCSLPYSILNSCCVVWWWRGIGVGATLGCFCSSSITFACMRSLLSLSTCCCAMSLAISSACCCLLLSCVSAICALMRCASCIAALFRCCILGSMLKNSMLRRVFVVSSHAHCVVSRIVHVLLAC